MCKSVSAAELISLTILQCVLINIALALDTTSSSVDVSSQHTTSARLPFSSSVIFSKNKYNVNKLLWVTSVSYPLCSLAFFFFAYRVVPVTKQNIFCTKATSSIYEELTELA